MQLKFDLALMHGQYLEEFHTLADSPDNVSFPKKSNFPTLARCLDRSRRQCAPVTINLNDCASTSYTTVSEGFDRWESYSFLLMETYKLPM